MKNQLFCLALLLLLFVGCAKEIGDPNGEKPSVPEGIPTSVTFNFSTESGFGTRTGDDGKLPEDTAPSADPTIKTIHILIFDETNETLISKIEENVQAKKTVTVPTTSGVKRIFTLVNTPACFLKAIEGYTIGLTTLTEFYALKSNPIVVNSLPLENPDDGLTTRDQSKSLAGLGSDFKSMVDTRVDGTGIFMSNGASFESKYILQPNITAEQSSSSSANGAVNNFNIIVMRAAARARLTYESKLEVASESTGSAGLKVIKTRDMRYEIRANNLGDIKYGVRNLNRSTYAVQHFIDDDVKDSDSGSAEIPGAVIAVPRAPYYNEFSDVADRTNEEFGNYYWDSGFDSNTPALADGVNPSDAPTGSYYFIPENNNNDQVIGNTSYFGVMAIVQHVDAKHILMACNLVESTKDLPLKRREYDLVPGQSEDHFNYAPDGNQDQNTIYVLRREPELTINGTSRVAKDPEVAFKLFYHMLEADGIIGTPENNNVTVNAGIWGKADESIMPEDKRFQAPTTTDLTDPAAQGYLYFVDPEIFKKEFMTLFNGLGKDHETQTRARALVAHFKDMKKYELHKIFGVYISAKHYYRLSISEKRAHNTINIVRRNYSYSANITGFKTIGEPLADGLDNPPETPVNDELTFLTADITIQPWREKEIEEII